MFTNKPSIEALSRYFKKARLKADLSQKYVSEKLGYSNTQIISKWEKGLCTPPETKIKKIVNLYKIDEKEFVKIILELRKEEIEDLLNR